MEAPGMKYTAIRAITAQGDSSAIAYQPGDLVHEDAVTGPQAWLVLGEDVEAREGSRLEKPAANASQAAWAAWAIGEGADPDEAVAMSRAQLIKEYGTEPEAPSGA